MAEVVHVAVGVLQRADGRVLVAHRDAGRHQGDRLEFPGGKIEPGEDPTDALARELREELGVLPTSVSPLIRVGHGYADRTVVLNTELVTRWDGEPRGAEGQHVDWLRPEALDHARFPAANRPIVAALQLPAIHAITPEPEGDDRLSRARIATAVRAALESGTRLVQLRAHGMAPEPWSRLLEEILETTERVGSRLLVNTSPEAAAELPPGIGLHLTAARAAQLRQRLLPPGALLSCSCHDAGELAAAERMGADIALLGPVEPTPTHPRARCLGWETVQRLAAGTTLPIYALGGLAPGDLPRARQAGAVGVAGIRSFW